MADDARLGRRMFTTGFVALVSTVTLLVGVLAGFLLTHYGVDGTGGSGPDPETVTCAQWTGLSQSEKNDILSSLNAEHGGSVDRTDIDYGCGIDKPTRPVSGIVVQDS